MRMNLSLVVASTLVISAFIVSSAKADDVGPPVWTGFYAGAQIGYGWGRDRIHDSSLSTGDSDYSDRFKIDGMTGGVHGGYNYQTGPWVVGAEADIELANVDGDNPDWPFGDNTKAKIDSQGSLRLRGGYAIGQTLLYATGGLALAHVKTDYYDGSAHDSYSDTKAGWTIGTGLECAFTTNWTARVEYRYVDLGRISDHTTTTDSGWQEHNDLQEHAIRVGVSYKF